MLEATIKQQQPIPLEVQLECAAGEMLALVGPSGSGKTTVLRCIAGLHKPQQGLIRSQTIWFDSNHELNYSPQQRRVGMVFQNYALFPHLTVMQNIMLAMQTPQEHKVRALLEQVHLSGLESRFPSQLSGGQQQRVALARALARDPEVLLLDEPFSAVDKVTRRKLYLELHALRRQLSMPIILVTHDLDEAAMLADQMCVIHQGKTLQQGTVEDVLNRPQSLNVARLTDARNVFEGKIVLVEGQKKLQWCEQLLEIADTDFAVGSNVYWIIAPSKILLHQRRRPSRGEQENPVQAIIDDMITLRGITTVLMKVTGHNPLLIQMDIPEHVVERNQLQRGEHIGLSLLRNAIHLIEQ
ncbi:MULTISPECIES: ABC transporter ATP-binding protein [unclassified Methylophaga]|jgi:molybdate transport system ATP-binding protein|nr:MULTISPECIES: ABC transporter ATP-binding protein [unclassified Methylophaga]|tara:strand:- start:64226 stop:65290 length:1065 start_codon:yes stop_codon:yes gene_type:complete